MSVKTEHAARGGRSAAWAARGGSAGGERLSRADRMARGEDANYAALQAAVKDGGVETTSGI
jgi:hypothetical protein